MRGNQIFLNHFNNGVEVPFINGHYDEYLRKDIIDGEMIIMWILVDELREIQHKLIAFRCGLDCVT